PPRTLSSGEVICAPAHTGRRARVASLGTNGAPSTSLGACDPRLFHDFAPTGDLRLHEDLEARDRGGVHGEHAHLGGMCPDLPQSHEFLDLGMQAPRRCPWAWLPAPPPSATTPRQSRSRPARQWAKDAAARPPAPWWRRRAHAL